MNLRNIAERLNKMLLFLTEFALDGLLYARFCGISPFQDGSKKASYKILIEAHAIEKGLSFAQPRPLFGREKIARVMSMVRRYGIGSNELPITMAVGALQAYVEGHREMGLSDPMLDLVDDFLVERRSCSETAGAGGLRVYCDGKPAIAPEPAGLLLNRFSCRMFATEPLSRDEIGRIVEVAQTAPSQCNRQATQIHYYDSPTQIKALLTLQGGSSGFLDDVPGLFIVAFDLAAWGGAQQRNQGYVDGSLFAMTLMLSAQAHGAVTCPLNLAVRHRTEHRIKMTGGIPVDQRLVMMIAIGRAPLGLLKAAASPRRNLEDVLTFRSA